MNCVDWEERIALYAGGDLAPAEAQGVERHVAECAGCRVLLSGLRESLSLAREAHGEPVDAAHFAAVRARVLAKLESGPARRWRFGWMYAMAAAAVVVLMAVWPRREEHMVLPTPQAPAAASVAKVTVKPPVRRPRFTRPAAPTETVLVKLETDNPDVVIYWIAETKGETK
jgi:anti-sigma factor RsiW